MFDTFNRWYLKSLLKDKVLKFDNKIEIELKKSDVQILFVSFLIHKQNENFKLLLSIFNQIEDVLNAK